MYLNLGNSSTQQYSLRVYCTNLCGVKTVGVSVVYIIKILIFITKWALWALQMGFIYAPDQGFQNAINNECLTNFLMKLWASENRQVVWRLYAARLYGRIAYK